ncbi:MAG TPA: class I SAM-dependent rRNA methyltransferase [Parachlamydiaceae bacterium]|nr:class I SAM-dependent rRNA methyltransferase [Parachlamydiaceae bacterium]
MSERHVTLKPGKEKPVRNRHHWIFSGAIAKLPEFGNGDCLQVCSSTGEKLGWGYFNTKTMISGRMLSFDETLPEVAIYKQLEAAIKMRSSLFDHETTNAYRLINGEGDLLPGLIVDRYNDVLVIQISTLGMQKFRSLIVEWLVKKLAPRSIYEKSLLPSRKEEGLHDEQGALFGEVPSNGVEIIENGMRFFVSILHGQKTGFFLDHREMRKQIRSLAAGKRVLNCFAYTGGFSVYAAQGGATAVDSVDLSAGAMQMAERNMELNGFASPIHNFYTADVFDFLRERPLDYDIVILDPPAFAKRQKDVVAACRGYKDINRIAMEKMPAGSVLLTSSCSYHVNEELFQTVVFQAAVEAKRTVRIIGRHRMAADHPVNICHPESDYLKSLLLYIE